jgi:hypothetical protein
MGIKTQEKTGSFIHIREVSDAIDGDYDKENCSTSISGMSGNRFLCNTSLYSVSALR